MPTTRSVDATGIAEVVMDNPPVNALTVAGWFELARMLRELGEDPAVRVVVLRAEGRGFNAGVDIKEMQATDGFDALIGANRGCFAAFAAVYECAVPVIAAVNGYCLGGGVGLAGNADIVVASDDATFGLPEVDRGALGAATHLARLVPQHRMRAMVYTAATITAPELLEFGSVLRVVPLDELRGAAMEVAAEIAAKSPTVIRAAKESLNGIDPIDVKRSYRYEQGFTFELNLSGVADEHRDAFVAGRDTDTRSERQDHHRGRGRRRDPRRHDDRHRRLGLSPQADEPRAGPGAERREGPHRRLVRRSGPRAAVRDRQGVPRRSTRSARSTRSRSSRTSAPRARPARCPRSRPTRGCSSSGCRPRRGGCRSCRRASGSAPTSSPASPRSGRWSRPTPTARSWSPRRRCTSTSR